MDARKVHQYPRSRIASLRTHGRLRRSPRSREELLHALEHVPKSPRSKEPWPGRKSVRVRHARIIATRARNCELAADLYRKGIGQALGRRRGSEFIGFQGYRV